MESIDRRSFVALAAVATASAAELKVFTEEEAKWISSIQNQIIPEDDSPGAVQAGCLQYLDRQLGSALSRFVSSYRNGLKAFQQKEPQFLEMNAAQQIEVLQKLDRDPFFEMLVDHTMQGFYGSPEHGGNRDEASWKMMGIEKYMGGGHWHGV
jgi:gluconate 2-dehydrogenase gamma chain